MPTLQVSNHARKVIESSMLRLRMTERPLVVLPRSHAPHAKETTSRHDRQKQHPLFVVEQEQPCTHRLEEIREVFGDPIEGFSHIGEPFSADSNVSPLKFRSLQGAGVTR